MHTNLPPDHPDAGEDTLAMIPGEQPGTALRVRYENCPGGCVRLELLAHSRTVGWYVQKTLRIPAEMLPALVPELRKAHCLIPAAARDTGDPYPFPLRHSPTGCLFPGCAECKGA